MKRGTLFKTHGIEGAAALREALGHAPNEVPDVFTDLRRLGLHVFRRRLQNPNISGLFINHPTAGPCVLVNSTTGGPCEQSAPHGLLVHLLEKLPKGPLEGFLVVSGDLQPLMASGLVTGEVPVAFEHSRRSRWGSSPRRGASSPRSV